MHNLIDVSAIKSILAQKNLKPQKALGQNFLVSDKVLQEFLRVCGLTQDDIVLEVGGGLGTLTVELARQVSKVITVELDLKLFEILQENLKSTDCTNVIALKGDILKDGIWHTIVTLLSSFISSDSRRGWKVISSLPYQITSPLLHQILFEERLPKLIVFIVQKEVAEKLAAQPPRASYLANLIRLFGPVEILKKSISPAAFWPRPKVESSIVRIRFGENPPDLDLKEFSQFLHQGFSHPRKMLNKVFLPDKLITAGIDPQQRAGNLPTDDWQRLYTILKKGSFKKKT